MRVNAAQRPTKRPTEIQRLGHVVLGTTGSIAWACASLRGSLPDHSTPGRTDLGP